MAHSVIDAARGKHEYSLLVSELLCGWRIVLVDIHDISLALSFGLFLLLHERRHSFEMREGGRETGR